MDTHDQGGIYGSYGLCGGCHGGKWSWTLHSWTMMIGEVYSPHRMKITAQEALLAGTSSGYWTAWIWEVLRRSLA